MAGEADPETRLAFDLAVMEYGETMEAKLAETVEAPAPKTRKDPTIRKPRYGPEDIRRFLGVDEDDARESHEADPWVDELAETVLRGTADWLTEPPAPVAR